MDATPQPFKSFSHLSSGARFWRVDMHMHSYGVSRDVTDKNMTVPQIVETALNRGLDMIAVTDHNAIDSVKPLLDAVRDDLVAIPGVELSTGEGHALVYFGSDQFDAFHTWFNRLEFKQDEAGDRHLLVPIHELLESVDKAGGIAVPAHIGRENTGFLARVSPQIEEAVLTSPFLRAVEVDQPAEASWYSQSDTAEGSQRRLELLGRREKSLGPVTGRRLAKLLFSDAHSLDRIGRDRDGRDRVTRIKMGEPSFGAFRAALSDPDARIKLEADLPSEYPQIVGARFHGGFLDGQEIAFSPNLTCLIGGRGTGKSTAIESVRCACIGSESLMDHKPNFPDTVQLVYRDEFGHHHFIKRDVDRTSYALEGDNAVEIQVEIEGYDQDRIAAIVRGYRDNPRQLLEFLDRFADLDAIQGDIGLLREELEKNRDDLAPLLEVPSKLKQENEALSEIQLKLKALRGSNLEEALKWRRRLQRERQAREELEARLRDLDKDIDGLDVSVDLQQLATSAEIDGLQDTPSAEILLGKDGAPGLIKTVADLDRVLDDWKSEGTSHLGKARTSIEEGLASWKQREQAIEARVQAVFEGLRKRDITPNIAEFNKLTAAEAASLEAIRKLTNAETRRINLLGIRRDLLANYRAEQARQYQSRAHAMKTLTGQLNDAFEEFKVKLAFREGAVVDQYADWVRNAVSGRFLKGRRIENLCRTLPPIELADLARRGDTTKLGALADDSSNAYFGSPQEAADFATAIRAAGIMELESIAPEDRPEISLTTEVKTKPRKVDFENLSFGQKASILLGALLFSSEKSPLIIDQPEDHLDSQFIARTVVSVLRRVKERRQVIVATHNANITILGDAEQIVPLQGYEGRGLTRDVGSVDAPATRKRACEILEGGDAAYLRRGEMYGFKFRE